MSRKRVPICGLLVPTVGKPTTHGGGHIYPGARDIGTSARVSESTAKYLTTAFGRRMPRPGYEVEICNKTWLRQATRYGVERDSRGRPRGTVKRHGEYEVVRMESGGLRGGKRKRRR